MQHLQGALEAATRYGFKIFPLRGKGAPVADWQTLATSDPITIVQWAQGGYPGYGIKCGPDSGVWVVDDDRAKHSLPDWAPSEGPLPSTLRTIGQSGLGCRWIFKWPTDSEPIKNSNHGRIDKYVDVRASSGHGNKGGDGSGYIVCWGSFGGAVLEHAPPAPAPEWLVSKARGANASSSVPTAPAPTANAPAWLLSTPWHGTADNDQQTFEIACKLCSTYPWLGQEGLIGLLSTWYSQHAQPPWEGFLAHKIACAWDATAVARAATALLQNNGPQGLPSCGPLTNNSQREPNTDTLTTQGRPSNYLAEIKAEGARIPLGFPPLDRRCRGGVFSGWLVTLGGAPATGKTMLLTQIGAACAKNGHEVRHFAVDEEPVSIAQRLAQQCGASQDAAEAGNGTIDATIDNNYRIFGPKDFDYLDQVDWAWETEDGSRVHILLIDSLQTVRTTTETSYTTRKDRVDMNLLWLKKYASKHPRTIVICTSELRRGAYSSKQDEEGINLISAAKESGNIEYHSSLFLVLQQGELGRDDIVFTLAKARRNGECGRWHERLNFERCLFASEETPAEQVAAATQTEQVNVDLAIEGAIRKQVQIAPHKMSKNNIHLLIQYQQNGWSRDRVRAVFELLCREDFIAVNGKGRDLHYSIGRADWVDGHITLFGS